jgi:protein SHQ1
MFVSDELTTSEQEQLLRLPKRELLPLDVAEQRSALLGLAELIFCWAHEQRSSSGDPGPESARSVRRLSATFSWLRQFHSAKQLTLSCMRRALCVPLYRNWNLAMQTLQDTQQILRKGKLNLVHIH